jgi:hypothetical protein
MRFCGKAQLAFAGVGQLGSIHKVLWWRPHGKSQGFFVVPPMSFSGEGQHGTIRLCPGVSRRTPFAFQKPEIR